jgi:hypothetical protein
VSLSTITAVRSLSEGFARRQIFVCLAFTAIASAIGGSYGALTSGNVNIGATSGAMIGTMIIGFEVFVLQRRIGAPLRRLPFLTTGRCGRSASSCSWI